MYVVDITQKKRSKVITLSEHTTITQRQIAQECSVSLGAVNKIINQKHNYGTIITTSQGALWPKTQYHD